MIQFCKDELRIRTELVQALIYFWYIELTWRSWRGLPTVAEILDERTTKFKAKLEAFNTILGSQKFMGGDEFSLVDIFYLPYTAKLYEVGLGSLIDDQPNVKAWWERVSTRDSWKQVQVLAQEAAAKAKR